MRRSTVILSGLMALAMAVAGPALAVPLPLIATGTVVSKARDSLVVRTEDHGHRITFAIDATTVLPAGVASGRRVRVVYHADGSTGQTADEVVLLEERAPKRER